jgi:Asp-tRNA(Asn)/Glu-tRNA(Gln) amidotransferase A subunit family amidase
MLRLSLALVLVAVPSAARPAKPAPGAKPFTVVEASIADLRTALEQHRVTSREIVEQYLRRIALYEDRLNAVMTVNPDALRDADELEATFDGRPALATGGSSSGVGTTASFWAANVGTETSGSILSPANQNMLAAIKPTVGRVSRYGIIPITADQDTAGPMARSVADAAVLLGVLEGASPDPNDPATSRCPPPAGHDYTRFLNPKGLQGARIGIPRANFYDKVTPPGAKEPRGGLSEDQARVMAEAIAVLKQQGAVLVDPADIPSVLAADAASNFLSFGVCSGLDNAKGKDADCSVVFKYGMKRDFGAWLASLGPKAPVKTLTELRQWNVAHQKAGAIKYGQALLDAPTRWTCATIAPATRQIGRRTSAWRARKGSMRS